MRGVVGDRRALSKPGQAAEWLPGLSGSSEG